MRKLDPFQNLKEPSCRGCTERERPHMVQFKTFRKLADCQKKIIENFYTEIILTLILDEQFKILKDCLLFQNASMRFGVSIWLSWTNCPNLITVAKPIDMCKRFFLPRPSSINGVKICL